MLSLNLPAFDAKIAARNGKNVIFDVIRRRYVPLTPEEWVRQHFVHFLLAHKGYPQALMANEVQVQLNGTKTRCMMSALSARPYRPDDCDTRHLK